MVRTGIVVVMLLSFVGICADFFGSPAAPLTRTDLGPMPQVDPVDNQSDDLSSMFKMEDFVQGDWTIGQSKWQFHTTDVRQTPSEEEFARPPVKLRGRFEEFDDQVIVDAFDAYFPSTKKVGDLIYRRASLFGVNGAMYTSNSPEGEIVQTLRIAFPIEKGLFTYLEASPSEFGFADSQPPELLPLCDGADQIAIRKDQQGTVSSSIINFSGSEGIILNHWSNQGWNVVLQPRRESPNNQYRCEKGSVRVMATFVKSESVITIMAIRIPD